MSETDHELLIRIDERIGQIKRTLERREELCQQVVTKFTERIASLEANSISTKSRSENRNREAKSDQASSLNNTSIYVAIIISCSSIAVALIALFR